MRFLLRLEGVNFSSFLTDTNDLSTIRGGSLALLEAPSMVGAHLLERLKKADPAATVTPISIGASSGILAVNCSPATHLSASAITTAVRELCNAHPVLRFASIVVDAIPSDAAKFTEEGEQLLALNRWRQMNEPSICLDGLGHDADEPCSYDHMRPATTSVSRQRDGGSTEEPVSAATEARHTFGREQKHSFYTEVASRLKMKVDWSGTRFAWDLQSLASDPTNANLDGKIAVIHLDGTGFGRLQRSLVSSEATQRDWDREVQVRRGTFLVGLVECMRRNGFWRNSKGELCIETLVWGGDDITWVVPARCGWTVAAKFFDAIETEKWQIKDPGGETHGLWYSGGLVYCHAEAPIHRIHQRARSLRNDLAKPASMAAGGSVANELNAPKGSNALACVALESFDDIGGSVREVLAARHGLRPESDETGKGRPVDSLALVGPWLGRRMAQAAAAVRQLQGVIPRRKLIIAANPRLSPESRKAAASEIEQACKTSRIYECDALTSIERLFPIPATRWILLNELWDYLIPHEPDSESPTIDGELHS